MRPKKRFLHELLYTEILKSGTNRLASGGTVGFPVQYTVPLNSYYRRGAGAEECEPRDERRISVQC